jgi:hypothetical protein
MPIVIESVSLESYLLWLSSQNSPPHSFSQNSLKFSTLGKRFYSTSSSPKDSASASTADSNLHNNPHLDRICAKIIELLPMLTPAVLEYALNFLIKNRKSLVRELNLPTLFSKNLPPAFSASLPEGFSTLFSFKGLPGIYYISSKEGNVSYVGSSLDIYKRCGSHFSNSAKQVSKHPKFYSYIGKYGWNSMQVHILIFVPDYTKKFMIMNPSLQLNLRDLELLFLLTKYHLLVAEQFSIDTLQPTLNCDLIVNWGGQPNKGGTGYKHSEAEILRRSLDLRGRSFSEQTKDLHRQNRLGTTL